MGKMPTLTLMDQVVMLPPFNQLTVMNLLSHAAPSDS
jgi:hypothetical protein